MQVVSPAAYQSKWAPPPPPPTQRQRSDTIAQVPEPAGVIIGVVLVQILVVALGLLLSYCLARRIQAHQQAFNRHAYIAVHDTHMN